jgi:hypothetical protein
MKIEVFTAAYWVWFGKYVLRIGKPWGHPYKYAWRPAFSFFKALT